MTLMLHAGANPVTYEDLRSVPVRAPTDTHVPVPHHEIVELMRYTLGFHQHEIADEHHAVTQVGARYFGVLCLRSPYGDYSDMLGLRNSHDKSLPIGIAFGSRVFVCDNLAFSADCEQAPNFHPHRRRRMTPFASVFPCNASSFAGYRWGQPWEPIRGQMIRRSTGIPGKSLRLETKALFGSLDHGLCCADLGLANGAGGLDINDDAELHIDEIIVGVREECRPFVCASPLDRGIGRRNELRHNVRCCSPCRVVERR
jgi:hypothetical protein